MSENLAAATTPARASVRRLPLIGLPDRRRYSFTAPVIDET